MLKFTGSVIWRVGPRPTLMKYSGPVVTNVKADKLIMTRNITDSNSNEEYVCLKRGVKVDIDWNYETQETWPGACCIGVAQSPINIETSKVVLDKHGVHIRGPLQMRGYDGVLMDAVNTGRTLKWRVKCEHKPVLSGGPLRANYTLIDFHLHWISEHAIDSLKYPMEIHMVHIKEGLSIEEALEVPDGLAIIAVFCQTDCNESSQYAFQQLMQSVPLLLKKTDVPKQAGRINISKIISPEPQLFYTYHGSLTTPNCQESATWIVMEMPIFISDAQYKLITKADVGGSHNCRKFQVSNRIVYKFSPISYLSSPAALPVQATIAYCLIWLARAAHRIKKNIFGLNHGRSQGGMVGVQIPPRKIKILTFIIPSRTFFLYLLFTSSIFFLFSFLETPPILKPGYARGLGFKLLMSNLGMSNV